MSSSLSDLMLACGVLNCPAWFSEVPLPHWPMPHQVDMMKKYPRFTRFGDFGEPGIGKTYPAMTHAVFMASIGNRVVFTTLPSLIPQLIAEFEVFFPGINNKLKIDHLDCSPAQKRKKEDDWEANGWPDILVMSYDIYRAYNDKHPTKNIGPNRWRLRDRKSVV